MSEKCIHIDYTEIDLSETKRFDIKVKEKLMLAIISIVFMLETFYNLKDT